MAGSSRVWAATDFSPNRRVLLTRRSTPFDPPPRKALASIHDPKNRTSHSIRESMIGSRDTSVRINIVIDDKLMRDSLRTTGLKTTREAVEHWTSNNAAPQPPVGYSALSWQIEVDGRSWW